MRLLASGSHGDNSGLIGALFVLGVIAYVVYHVYIFFARPDQWAEMQRRKHEKEMADSRGAQGQGGPDHRRHPGCRCQGSAGRDLQAPALTLRPRRTLPRKALAPRKGHSLGLPDAGNQAGE